MNTTTTIPNSEDPPSSPRSSIFASFRRYLLSISPRKTLRNLRLLILALAFGTLILDAITLSFEINVMNLDLAQKAVATQAALLFTPDLLAMTMVLVLMLRDCFGSCRTHRPHHHHHGQEYEGTEVYQNEGEEIEGTPQQLRQQQELKEIGLQGHGLEEHEGVDDQQRGKSRSRSSRTSRRGMARELHQDGSRSRNSSVDGYRVGGRVEQEHQEGGIIFNINDNSAHHGIHHGQTVPDQEQRSPNFPVVHVQQQQQQQQHPHHPREQPRYETHIAPNNSRTQQPSRTSPTPVGPELTATTTSGLLDLTNRASIPLSSSTTLSTPSPIRTTATSSAITAAVTMTNDSNSMHTKASTSSSTQARNKQRRKKRHSYYYIAFRIVFSCGLAVLALYWPASKRKPPLGYLPNLRESQNQHSGDGFVSHNNNINNTSNNNGGGGGNTQYNSAITPTLVARALIPYELSEETNLIPPTSTSTSTSTSRSRKSKRQRSSYDDIDNDNDGALTQDKNSSDNLESAASGHYGHTGGSGGTGPGGHIPPNLRPGGPGSGGYGSHWCSLEEAFGDNQSAVVYCQVKDVRPIMTYVWASLILLELCVACCAGDFTIAGTTRQKRRSSPLVAVDDGDEDLDLESKRVAAVAATSSENHHPRMEAQEPQSPWTTVEQGQVHSQGQGHHHPLGYSGISITVTEAGADGAGVGYGDSMDRGQTLRGTGRIGPPLDR
ncbi:hypothetical protein EC968_008596 [Mortierella alpina]|nr:hypothetical protein EC968_008596 [Mortierella alpina]